MPRSTSASQQVIEAARSCGLTQDEIARRIGLSRTSVSRVLAGKLWLSKRSFDALVELLGLKIVSIRGRVSD